MLYLKISVPVYDNFGTIFQLLFLLEWYLAEKILCKVPKDTQYLHDYSIEPVKYTCVFALTEASYSSLSEYLGANEEVHELADAAVPTRP